MEAIFVQLAVILAITFVLSYLSRILKQPIIIGYIIAGIALSPFIIKFGASTDVIQILSKFGVAFLLFTVGLHMNPKSIKEVGFPALLIGLAQMALTFGAGFLVAWKALNFDVVTSAYVGVALAFSSTIIVMKLLSDKGHLESLYGKISIGILIVQDLVAVIALMVVSSISGATDFGNFAVRGILGGAGLIVVLFLLGFFVLPKLTKYIAKSQELLFLFSITWAFGIAALFGFIGFSVEIGALIAGVALSVSPYSPEMSSKIKPLRDFFLILFFIILGLNIQIANIQNIIVNALILSAIALLFKPLILMTFSAIFRYSKRTNFLVGTTLAQISEFSLIFLALGVSLGHISGDVLSTLTLTGIITIAISSYFIIYSNKFYEKVSGAMAIFERKNLKPEKKSREKFDAILFGYNRIGFGILESLKKIRENFLVVDFNPDVITKLQNEKVPCLYGDVYDEELLEELPLDGMKIAISTIPDFETNEILIETIRAKNPDAVIIVRAHQIDDALELYKLGANYVLTPHFIGGEHIAKLIKKNRTGKRGYGKEKRKHMTMLKEMVKRGKKHPEIERG